MTTHRRGRAFRWRVVAASAIALGGVALAPTDGLAAAASEKPAPTSRVIVQATDGTLAGVAQAANRLGGAVVSTQRSLGTAVLDVPSNRLDDLRALPGVREVTEDMSVRLTGLTSPLSGPTGLPGDMSNITRDTGAQTFWRNGFTGQGVDVALLDSGVLPVEGLNTTNKLVVGPDLSFDSQSDTMRGLDTFGHGTHMAGIIGGLDGGVLPAAFSTTNRFVGMAPNSRIVSLKLADAQGQTDVSQVIAGMDWVVEHAHDAGMNIRVLNLSFGTDSAQDYRLDPLAHAAEVAWASGIVVVASAGNGETADGGLANPAYDPAVLAVGSLDNRGTTELGDDVVAGFSKKGNGALGKRGPDLLAPGVSVVSLRAPGSYVDLRHADTAVVNERFFKGSGTSQSAAVVSGAAALLLSQRPTLTPDQVRDLLKRSARSLGRSVSKDAQGDGTLNLDAAYTLDKRLVATAKVNNGGGSLDAARGQFKVKKNGVALTGEQDIFGKKYDAAKVATQEESTTTWTDGGLYNGDTWTGKDWLGDPALGASWSGTKWRGATWAGATWTGATWAGGDWSGATWAGATWTGATWAGATWAGATWAGATWADAVWASASWE